MSGQTFRVPVDQNPGRASFYAPWAGKRSMESTFAVTPNERVSGRLRWSIRESGMWNSGFWAGSDVFYTWLDDITISPTEVTVRIRDEATWSDGHPITGQDIAVELIRSYLRNPFPPYFVTDEKENPTIIRDAIDEFDITDKAVTYRSSPGYFEKFWDSTIRAYLGVWRHSGGKAVPTHIEPYDTFADAVFETARRAQQGEINPWKGWNDRYTDPNVPHAASLDKKHLAKGGKYVAKFSNPEHVISTSAWNLIKINGPEAVFHPNPHHRHAENIKFGRLILEYTPSEERAWPALKADRLDYAAPGPTPQAVVESLPDPITELQIPGWRKSGNELGLNFNHPSLGNRNVRLALMYALDQPTIANNIHHSTALPVTTPGGDSWNVTDYVSEEWIDENLNTYPQDRNKAASLMQEAGYTKDGGQWLNANGEPFTLPLTTPNTTPRWEPTVASQLTEFGIETSVQTLKEGTFEMRLEQGELSIWAESGVASSTASRPLLFWIHVPNSPKVYGIYPKSQFETGDFSRTGAPVPRTEERYEVFTIKAPPIGQPKGPLQEYHPSALAMAFFSHPPEDEFRRRIKTALWLTNWFLPTIPINKTMKQYFIDDTHWQWPTDTPSWQMFTSSGPNSIGEIFVSGTIRANPDKPEDEAT